MQGSALRHVVISQADGRVDFEAALYLMRIESVRAMSHRMERRRWRSSHACAHQDVLEILGQLLSKLVDRSRRDGRAQCVEHRPRMKDRLLEFLIFAFGDPLEEIVKAQMLEVIGTFQMTADFSGQLGSEMRRGILLQPLTERFECRSDDRFGIAAGWEMRAMLHLSDKFVVIHGCLHLHLRLLEGGLP
jgi:hypothetical protein